MNNKWNNVDDMIEALHDAHSRLRSGESKVEEVQAEVRAIDKALKFAALAIEHGRLSGRIVNGDDTIPSLDIRRKMNT